MGNVEVLRSERKRWKTVTVASLTEAATSVFISAVTHDGSSCFFYLFFFYDDK